MDMLSETMRDFYILSLSGANWRMVTMLHVVMSNRIFVSTFNAIERCTWLLSMVST